jgi:hypothetical protein
MKVTIVLKLVASIGSMIMRFLFMVRQVLVNMILGLLLVNRLKLKELKIVLLVKHHANLRLNTTKLMVLHSKGQDLMSKLEIFQFMKEMMRSQEEILLILGKVIVVPMKSIMD